MDDNGTALAEPQRSVPLLGPEHESPRGNWRVQVVVDGCSHPAKEIESHSYGTARCKVCNACRGPDGLWRQIVVQAKGGRRGK